MRQSDDGEALKKRSGAHLAQLAEVHSVDTHPLSGDFSVQPHGDASLRGGVWVDISFAAVSWPPDEAGRRFSIWSGHIAAFPAISNGVLSCSVPAGELERHWSCEWSRLLSTLSRGASILRFCRENCESLEFHQQQADFAIILSVIKVVTSPGYYDSGFVTMSHNSGCDQSTSWPPTDFPRKNESAEPSQMWPPNPVTV